MKQDVKSTFKAMYDAVHFKISLYDILKGIGVVFLAILFLSFFFNMSVQDKVKSSTPVDSEAKYLYTLTAKEQIILNAILKSLADNDLPDQDSIFSNELILVSANQVAQDYDVNQVSADQKYYNKWVLLSAQIYDINSGVGNDPDLILYGGDYFFFPQASFKDKNMSKIANLRKDQLIELVCKSDGVIMGAPIFKECLFFKDYAREKIPSVEKQVESFLQGSKVQENIANLVIASIAAARKIPATSACFNDIQEACVIDLQKILSTKKGKAQLYSEEQRVVDELKAFDIKIDTSIYLSDAISKITPATPISKGCTHKHKQQYMRMNNAGVPEDFVCIEVCDSPDNKNYVPCKADGTPQWKFAPRYDGR